MTGIARELKRESRDSWLVLHRPGLDQPPRDDVGFFSLDSIEALTILDLPSLDAPHRDLPAAPQKLEVRRGLSTLEVRLAEALGTKVPCEVAWDHFEEGEPMRNLALAIAQLSSVVGMLAKEPLGLEALERGVRALELDAGDQLEVSREGQLLKVVVGATPRKRSTESQLKKALETVL